MNKATSGYMWEEFRLVDGVTLRAIQALPKDKLDAHPIPGMRTPKEIVAHMATMMRTVIEGVARGTIKAEEEAESGAAIRTHEDMVRIVDLELNKLGARLREKGIELESQELYYDRQAKVLRRTAAGRR